MRQDAIKWLSGAGTGAALVVGFLHFTGNEGPAFYEGLTGPIIQFSTLERCHEYIASMGYEEPDDKKEMCHLK